MIQPISNSTPNMAAEGVNAALKVQKPAAERQERPQKPVMDEYIPEKKQETTGRYWLVKDEEGQPKVYFDDPERADASEGRDGRSEVDGKSKELDAPEKKADGRKAETCRGSTDAVDREIEKLKKKKEKLEQQINSETDETKVKKLEKQLAQVERELRQKDTDAYRRQHTVFS